ncbi:hypothetical protein DFJ73DRAFT_785159 [Zopfochytrium polystomum]|nr:hypothetical protein DFJ73DRAFT_785159 [Zopfochytrium polystomum]
MPLSLAKAISTLAVACLALGGADFALAKKCLWTNVANAQHDVLAYDENVQDWSASHYWNWHYDNVGCFKNTWNFGNGKMSFAINDGARSMGFLYTGVLPGTTPDLCFVGSCQYIDTRQTHLQDYLPQVGWRTLSYCDLNSISCRNEGAILKIGSDCQCIGGTLNGQLDCRYIGVGLSC